MDKENQISSVDNELILRQYIQNQININRQAYELYLHREQELFEQVLSTFKINMDEDTNVIV